MMKTKRVEGKYLKKILRTKCKRRKGGLPFAERIVTEPIANRIRNHDGLLELAITELLFKYVNSNIGFNLTLKTLVDFAG